MFSIPLIMVFQIKSTRATASGNTIRKSEITCFPIRGASLTVTVIPATKKARPTRENLNALFLAK